RALAAAERVAALQILARSTDTRFMKNSSRWEAKIARDFALSSNGSLRWICVVGNPPSRGAGALQVFALSLFDNRCTSTLSKGLARASYHQGTRCFALQGRKCWCKILKAQANGNLVIRLNNKLKHLEDPRWRSKSSHRTAILTRVRLQVCPGALRELALLALLRQRW